MHRDDVRGIGNAVLLAVLIASLFLFEATAASSHYRVSWQTVERVDVVEGDLAADEERPHPFSVSGAELHRIEVHLQWEDPVGDDDSFRVTVVDGGGEERMRGTSSSGSLVLGETLVELPQEPRTVAAIDPEHARQRTALPSPWFGEQEWTVHVHLVEAPGTEGPVPALEEEDGAQSYTLRFVTLHHEATVTPV